MMQEELSSHQKERKVVRSPSEEEEARRVIESFSSAYLRFSLDKGIMFGRVTHVHLVHLRHDEAKADQLQ